MNETLIGIHKDYQEEGTLENWVPSPPIAALMTAWQITAISRYEVTNERALHRALLMLERRQARRRSEPVPAPIAIQVETFDSAEAPLAVIDSTAVALPDNARSSAEAMAQIG